MNDLNKAGAVVRIGLFYKSIQRVSGSWSVSYSFCVGR